MVSGEHNEGQEAIEIEAEEKLKKELVNYLVEHDSARPGAPGFIALSDLWQISTAEKDEQDSENKVKQADENNKRAREVEWKLSQDRRIRLEDKSNDREATMPGYSPPFRALSFKLVQAGDHATHIGVSRDRVTRMALDRARADILNSRVGNSDKK